MARVLAIERVALAEPEVVYNFTVKGPHTYFVLEVGVLVHNNPPLGCGLEFDAEGNPIGSGSYWYRKGFIYDSESIPQVQEMLQILNAIPKGQELLSKVRELEKTIPESQFELLITFMKHSAWGTYDRPFKNVVFLNEQLRHFPAEVSTPTLAHELSHRLRRWENSTLADEVIAHRDGAEVWKQLRNTQGWRSQIDNLPPDLKKSAEKLVSLNEETLRQLQKNDDEFSMWVKGRDPQYEILEDVVRRPIYEDVSGEDDWYVQYYLDQVKRLGK